MNKRSIVALGALLVAGASLAACGPSAPAAVHQGNTYDNPVDVPRPTVTLQSVGSATVETFLDEMQSSTQMLIVEYTMAGQQVPEYVYSSAQAIEKARLALRELDGQRTAINMLIHQSLMTTGELVPESLYETARSIEQSRQEILKGIGLAD